MECRNGKIVSEGIAVYGKIVVCDSIVNDTVQKSVADAEFEIMRYSKAVIKVCAELDILYEKTATDIGESEAEIFKAHKLLVCDEGYRKSVEDIIRNEKVCAECAVACTRDKYMAMFDGMEDGYFKARGADIRDISEHLISVLTDTDNLPALVEPSIIVAKELTPSETIKLDRKLVLGFVMEMATHNSHVAILARSMGVPMLTGVKADKEWNGKAGSVDAAVTGAFYIEPDKELLDKLSISVKECEKQKERLKVMKEKRIVTRDGRYVMLCANAGSICEVDAAIEAGAEGIGLFRTEMLFLGREDYPTEEEQLEIYRAVAEKCEGKPVVIRTLDIGVDKKADYMGLCYEENPALGMRGIRLCLERKKLFKTQLRAILRAAVYGNVSVMFPMITTADEVLRAKGLIEEAGGELYREHKEFGHVELGIMIETPAAALISDELAEHVEFFSIGTNDLTQYTLAADRQNAKVAGMYDAGHPAVIKLIEMTVKNAHEKGVRVGVCGEAAADVCLAGKLIELGVDELSVAPGAIWKFKEM